MHRLALLRHDPQLDQQCAWRDLERLAQDRDHIDPRTLLLREVTIDVALVDADFFGERVESETSPRHG